MGSEVRVVITGMGAVTPLALSLRETFDNMVAGRSGIATIGAFDPSRLGSRIAGEVRDFDPTRYIPLKTARRLGRNTQLAIAATAEAIAQSGLDLPSMDRSRVASMIATAIADFPLLEEQMDKFFTHGPGRTNPFTVPRVATSMTAAQIALEYDLTGPSYGTSSACATGSHALANAWMQLKLGLADVAIAGGTESAICESFFESYVAMRALSTRNNAPEQAMRPFDRNRDGFVIAEGSGVLVLETLEHARRRGAEPLAELAGIGMSADAYHITAPHPEGRGAMLAMQAALASAGLSPEQVDHINAHGTSTPLNDVTETKAIRQVFGAHADNIPVTANKSMLGHSIGAAGAIEAAVSVLSLREGVIPPTINLDDPDPECDLDYVPNTAREAKLDTVISNSFAFGGQNCVLVLRRWGG